MGDLRNISRAWAVGAGVAALLLGASAALAEDARERPPAAVAPAAAPDDAPVSMPPIAGRANAAGPASVTGSDTMRPLTRAAARERVDRMSPRGWLANYGQVVVGRRD